MQLNNLQKYKTWKKTAERYVCYIDIMGFKSMLLRKSHSEMYNLMLQLSYHLEETQEIADDPILFKPKSKVAKIAMMTYSDSIMIYSRDNARVSLKSFRITIQYFIHLLFESGIPFKGAISFGTITLDLKNAIYFGRPLVDAYMLAEELYYYGIVIDANAEFNSSFTNHPSIIAYECPFKKGIANHYTITLVVYYMKDLSESINKKLRSKIYSLRKMTSGDLRKYIDNTLKHFDYTYDEIKKVNPTFSDKEI